MKRIILENIEFCYSGSSPLFRNLNFELVTPENKGYVTAMMGSSGSGKTTLLKLLIGLLKPQKGAVIYHPRDTVFSYVPQEAVLFEHLSPLQNAMYFQYASQYKTRFAPTFFAHLTDLLEMRNILQDRKSVSELSGGQKQRLSLLRALSIRPEILFLDEPCTGLDADVKVAFLTKLHELTDELNLLTIYVTHHMDEAKFIGNEIAFLNKDNESSIIDNISKQSVREFIASPPSLDALRIANFPMLNILSVNNSTNNTRLADQAEKFLSIEQDNIEFAEVGNGIKFVKLFSTDMYSCYKHVDTQNVITFNSNVAYMDNEVYLKFNGSFKNYALNGMYEGQHEIIICQ